MYIVGKLAVLIILNWISKNAPFLMFKNFVVFFCLYQNCVIKFRTRMHSSRMHTGRMLTIFRGRTSPPHPSHPLPPPKNLEEPPSKKDTPPKIWRNPPQKKTPSPKIWRNPPKKTPPKFEEPPCEQNHTHV